MCPFFTDPLLSLRLHLLSQVLGVAVLDTIAAPPLKFADLPFLNPVPSCLYVLVLFGDVRGGIRGC